MQSETHTHTYIHTLHIVIVREIGIMEPNLVSKTNHNFTKFQELIATQLKRTHTHALHIIIVTEIGIMEPNLVRKQIKSQIYEVSNTNRNAVETTHILITKTNPQLIEFHTSNI